MAASYLICAAVPAVQTTGLELESVSTLYEHLASQRARCSCRPADTSLALLRRVKSGSSCCFIAMVGTARTFRTEHHLACLLFAVGWSCRIVRRATVAVGLWCRLQLSVGCVALVTVTLRRLPAGQARGQLAEEEDSSSPSNLSASQQTVNAQRLADRIERSRFVTVTLRRLPAGGRADLRVAPRFGRERTARMTSRPRRGCGVAGSVPSLGIARNEKLLRGCCSQS